MMKKSYSLLILILFVSAGYSQDIDYARSIIQKLSSPGFKGRGYVHNGDKLSANFIAEEFRDLGLLPGNKGSYYQAFNIAVNTFPGTVSVKLNGHELIPGKDFLIDAASPSIKGKFRVLKIPRSQIENEEKLADIVKKAGNSFILIDSRDKKNEKPEFTQKVDEYISFLKNSPHINTGGIIIYTAEKLSWEMAAGQAPRPCITITGDFDLNKINTIELITGAEFRADYETQNVIAYSEGRSGSDSMIIVTAHYDHLGMMGKDTWFPGANDNASGVAMILSLAKYYSVQKPEYTTVFIAFSAEELGLLGAKAFTDDPPVDLKKIKFLVNFDLAGTGDEGIKVVNGSVFRDEFDLLKEINEEQKLLPKIDIRGEACNSDHCLFYQKGVPCFYIYTLGGIQAYHDIFDRYETLPLTEFADYFRLILEFFRRI